MIGGGDHAAAVPQACRSENCIESSISLEGAGLILVLDQQATFGFTMLA